MNRRSIPAWLQLLLLIALLLVPQLPAMCHASCSGEMTAGHASMGSCAPGAMRRASCCTRKALATSADLAPMLCHCNPAEQPSLVTANTGAQPDQTVLTPPVTRISAEAGVSSGSARLHARPPNLSGHDPGLRLNLPIRI